MLLRATDIVGEQRRSRRKGRTYMAVPSPQAATRVRRMSMRKMALAST
jgi:hypothetical protein